MRTTSEGALRLDCALCLVQAVLFWSLFCFRGRTEPSAAGKTSAVSEGVFIMGDSDVTSASRKQRMSVSHTISASAVTRPVRSPDRQTDRQSMSLLSPRVRPHRHGLRWVGRVRRSCGVFESRRDLARTHAFSKQQRQTKAAPVLPRWRANDVAEI